MNWVGFTRITNASGTNHMYRKRSRTPIMCAIPSCLTITVIVGTQVHARDVHRCGRAIFVSREHSAPCRLWNGNCLTVLQGHASHRNFVGFLNDAFSYYNQYLRYCLHHYFIFNFLEQRNSCSSHSNVKAPSSIQLTLDSLSQQCYTMNNTVPFPYN